MSSPVSAVPDVLAGILAVKRDEVRSLVRHDIRAALEDAPPVRPFGTALRRGAEVALLAEVKPRSPSAGIIRPGVDPAEIAASYERGGAAAISVLTDERFFGGSLDSLRAVRETVGVPLLRKDFIIDEVQVEEARAAGADAILLIVAALEDTALGELHGAATALEMDVLVEVHDEEEMERALAIDVRMVGVNNRDLRTFRTDLGVTERLAAMVPPGVVLVGESGIRTPEDVARLGRAGVDAVLVGESLMRQPDVQIAAGGLVGIGRKDR